MASTLIPTKKRCTQKCRALPFLFTEGSDGNGVGTHSSVRNTFSGVPRLCAWIRAVLRGNAAHRRCVYLIERRLGSQARVPEPFSRHKSSLRSVWRNEYAETWKSSQSHSRDAPLTPSRRRRLSCTAPRSTESETCMERVTLLAPLPIVCCSRGCLRMSSTSASLRSDALLTQVGPCACHEKWHVPDPSLYTRVRLKW